MSSPAAIYHDEIDAGADFERHITLYANDTYTLLVDTTDKTPRAALMDQGENKIADFLCTWVEATDTKPKHVRMRLPRNISASLNPFKVYNYFLDLDKSDGTTERHMKGRMTVSPGEGPA